MTRRLDDAARRATPLDDRLGSHSPAVIPSPLAQNRFARWARYAAAGDEARLLRRLAWDGFTRDDALAALEDGVGNDARLDALGRAVDALGECSADVVQARLSELQALDPQPLPPFSLFAAALVQVEARELRAAGDELSSRVLARLERSAVSAIASLLQQLLYERFDALRQSLGTATGESRAFYDSFCRSLLARDQAIALLEQFAFAARGVDLLLQQYARNSRELLDRLRADRDELTALFEGLDLGALNDVEPALSDRHDGGRQVAILHFSSGIRLVYKPRSVALFAAFHALLRKLAEDGFEAAPPALRCLSREGWGWIEFARQDRLTTADQAATYFRRAGALLCLAWLSGARDLHMENVVATADGPVLIDLDAIVAPAEKPAGGGTFQQAADRIANSALATGFLSFSQVDADGRVYEAGGLCGVGGHLAANDAPVWLDVNTDAVRPGRERRHGAAATNIVMMCGVLEPAENHSEEIVSGFRAAYDYLASRRDELLAPGGALTAFAGEPTRIIFRPSEMYAAIQARLVAPPFLRDGIEASLLAESLNRVFLNDASRPFLWALTREERAQLLDFDIPIFHVDTSSVDLVARDGERMANRFARSGFAALEARLRALDDDDAELQCELISSALIAPAAPLISGRAAASADGQPLRDDELIDAARQLGDLLWKRAIKGADGAATWIGSRQLRQDARSDRGVSYYLYDGSVGVALLYAALARVSGQRAYLKQAESATAVLSLAVNSPHAAELLRNEGIGGANGLGSIIYALAHLAALTGDERYADLAQRFAAHLTPARISADTRLDLEGGTAGAIAGLLQLHSITGEESLVQAAQHAAVHLAQQSHATPLGSGWPTPEGALLAGFAHGAAGIGAALARFAAVSGDPAALHLAGRSHAFERSLYSADERNWPVMQNPSAPIVMSTWCHGAPGIALARMATLDVLDDPAIRHEIDVALDTTITAGAAVVDHLCCGTMGRVDALITAAQLFDRSDLRDHARRLASRVVHDAAARGGYALHPPPHHRVFEAGFFRGLSGIGYQLLRVAQPELIPSILSFAAPAGVMRSKA